jgi:hypothetical protein
MKWAQARPRRFDTAWLDRLRLAAKVLSDIQDVWLRSRKPFPARQATAVLLHIFWLSLNDALEGEAWSRPPATWFSLAESPERECEKFCEVRGVRGVDKIVNRLCGYLASAVERWEACALSDPSSESVAHGFLEQMAADQLVTLRYG